MEERHSGRQTHRPRQRHMETHNYRDIERYRLTDREIERNGRQTVERKTGKIMTERQILCFFLWQSVCMSVRLSVCLSVCLSFSLSMSWVASTVHQAHDQIDFVSKGLFHFESKCRCLMSGHSFGYWRKRLAVSFPQMSYALILPTVRRKEKNVIHV